MLKRFMEKKRFEGRLATPSPASSIPRPGTTGWHLSPSPNCQEGPLCEHGASAARYPATGTASPLAAAFGYRTWFRSLRGNRAFPPGGWADIGGLRFFYH